MRAREVPPLALRRRRILDALHAGDDRRAVQRRWGGFGWGRPFGAVARRFQPPAERRRRSGFAVHAGDLRRRGPGRRHTGFGRVAPRGARGHDAARGVQGGQEHGWAQGVRRHRARTQQYEVTGSHQIPVGRAYGSSSCQGVELRGAQRQGPWDGAAGGAGFGLVGRTRRDECCPDLGRSADREAVSCIVVASHTVLARYYLRCVRRVPGGHRGVSDRVGVV